MSLTDAIVDSVRWRLIKAGVLNGEVVVQAEGTTATHSLYLVIQVPDEEHLTSEVANLVRDNPTSVAIAKAALIGAGWHAVMVKPNPTETVMTNIWTEYRFGENE